MGSLALLSPGVAALVCAECSPRQFERGAHHHEADETSPLSTWRFHTRRWYRPRRRGFPPGLVPGSPIAPVAPLAW
jgi:hypothetical protein